VVLRGLHSRGMQRVWLKDADGEVVWTQEVRADAAGTWKSLLALPKGRISVCVGEHVEGAASRSIVVTEHQGGGTELVVEF